MSKRQRRRLLVAVAAVIAGSLPLLVLVALSYWQALREADNRRAGYAALALDRAERIFDSADLTLRDLVASVKPACTPDTAEALHKAVFNSLYFREAGLIYNQALQCTSDHILKSPMPITTPELLTLDDSLHISAPTRTLDPEPSIILLRRIGDLAAVYLLLNPSRLGGSLSLPQLLDREQATVTLQRFDGALLLQFGASLTRAGTPPPYLQSSMLSSSRYPIRATATTSRGAVMQEWRRSAALYGSVGLLTSALLFFFINKLMLRQFSMDAELRDALANDEFEVHYQPVIDVATGDCVGAEALLRWQHPQRGLVMPAVFFPIAEETGFVVPLTAWLMQRIKLEMSALLDAHPQMHLALNLSARHILHTDLVATVRNTFDGRLQPQRLILEITEQQLLGGDHDALVNVVEQLRDTGARLALDDFGTGYSSLKYLTQFRFDYLKIDKIFIDAIGSESVSAGLVDAIVDIAKRMQLRVVAEGVETAPQLEYLKALGVPLVQGWLYSKALPAGAFSRFVAQRQRDTGPAAP